MIKKRLCSLASLVNDGEKVFDIGCDHGLLDIYLTLNKNCLCKCCDVNTYIVNRAICNFRKYNVQDKIDVFVGNGFDDLNVNDETVILAGMGTSTILKILEKNRGNSIICQTNTDLYDLRFNICNMGYYIKDEDIIFENGRYYVSIRFEKGYHKYSEEEYLLGPILINKELIVDYANYLYKKNIKGYINGMKHNSNSELDNMMKILNKYKKCDF